MAIIGYDTYLEYTVVPSPLILNQKQDIIIIATLKTKSENGAPLSSVTVDNILVDFGSAGKGATDLTSSDHSITQSQLQQGSNWKITQGGGQANSLTVTPQPHTTGQVNTNAIFIKIKDVVVNDTKGNVNVTITESLSKVVSPGSDSGPTVNQTTVTVPKITGHDSAKTTFTSNHYYINAGNQPDVVLSWDGPVGASYSLQYLLDDKLKTVSPLTGSSYTLHPIAKPIMPKETTDFILKVNDDYITLTVIVENSHIYANKVSIDSTTEDPTLSIENKTEAYNPKVELTNAQGTWTIQTDQNNLSIKNSQGANLTLSSTGELTVNGGINIIGDSTITGKLTVTEGLAVSKDLTVNQNLTVTGNSTVGASSIVKGRGGKTYVGTLSSGNSFTIDNLFTTDNIQGFNYYELVFNSVQPNIDNDQSFGARFYGQGSPGPVYFQGKDYSSVFVGNDSGNHGFGNYKDQNYLRLWPTDRSGPTSAKGLLGSMTLFRNSTLGCVANLYAPDTYNNVGCQVWIEGTIGDLSVPASDIVGIEFNFYGHENGSLNYNGIASGYIDVYGWN